MKRLKKLIARCHERHINQLQQRKTSVAPAVYNIGIPYEYTVHYSHGRSVKLQELEEANISFSPIGRAHENNPDLRSYTGKRDNQLSKTQTIGSWEPHRWRKSWGIQVYTGIPSERYGTQWHDVNIRYEAICDAPDTVFTCIEALTNAVVNPLLTITKSGSIRLSFRVPDYLHPHEEKERLYIYRHTPTTDDPDQNTLYVEILGEKGYSRWDARYEILLGDLLDPPIISKDLLFAPIDILRDLLHEPSKEKQGASKPNKINVKGVYNQPPLTLGSRRLDLAKEAFLKRGYTYIQQNNDFHHWTLHDTIDRNKHITLWDRNGTVWVRAAAPGFGLPIETTPITDIWKDTGILPQIPTAVMPSSHNVLAVRQGEISPLAIKRPIPILSKEDHTENKIPDLIQNTTELQDLYNSEARILGLKTDVDTVENSHIESYLPKDCAICLNAQTPKRAKKIEQDLKEQNVPSYTQWKPRKYLWEQVKEIPINDRIAEPFKHGNVCIDAERCDALIEKGGEPNETICPQCPVHKECKQHGYLSQITTLQNSNIQVLAFPYLFFSPQYNTLAEEILKPIHNTHRFCIVDATKHPNLFLKHRLAIEMLKEWSEDWKDEPLGNFSSLLLIALQVKGRFDDESVGRIRSVLQAFQPQEEVICKQMCQVNIPCKVVERGYVDPDTGKELSQFTIVFDTGHDAYIPIDDRAENTLKALNLPFLQLQSFEVNKKIKVPMQMAQAIQLGALNIETVEKIKNFPTVCSNPSWTVWHQLKSFYRYFKQDEDARVMWDKKVFEYQIPPVLHPNIKRLLVISKNLSEQYLSRIFPGEVVEVKHLDQTQWTQGNKFFQIRTGIYPQETILDYNENWDVIGFSETGNRFFTGVLKEIEKDPTISHAIITYSAAIKQLTEIINRENVYFLQHPIDNTKYNNILEKTQVTWIIGAPEIPQGRIWRTAQTQFGSDEIALKYEKDTETGLYIDERMQHIYEQNITEVLRQTLANLQLDRLTGKTVILLSGLAVPSITYNAETLLFDWEDFEVADGLNKLPEVIATRQQFEKDRYNLTAKSSRQEVERVLGCSPRQANRVLQKFRGGARLRVPFRDQILSLLTDGNKKTSELVYAIEGNPEAVKNELKRLIDRGEIVRVQRGLYASTKDST